MKIRMSAIVLALWFAVAGGASAQETTGTLTGKLTDAQGLALPGATVTVTGTQGERSMVTDADGIFRAPFLVPGVYDVPGRDAGLQGRRAEGHPGQPRPDHVDLPEARRRRYHRDRIGRRHLDHRQHLVHHHRRGAVQRAAPDHPGRPPLHRYPVPGAGRQQRRVGGPRQPLGVGRFGPRQPLRGRRRERHQHRLRRGRLLLDHLRLARHGHAVRLHQGNSDQDRRLRGRVRPVDGRRGQRRDQERQQRPARFALRLCADRRDGSGLEDLPVGERHRQHPGHRPLGLRRGSRLPDLPEPSVLLRGDQPCLGEAHLHRSRWLPAEKPGRARSRPPVAVLLQQGHLADVVGAPARRLGVRRPGQGRHGPAALLVADRDRHLVVQRARVRRT